MDFHSHRRGILRQTYTTPQSTATRGYPTDKSSRLSIHREFIYGIYRHSIPPDFPAPYRASDRQEPILLHSTYREGKSTEFPPARHTLPPRSQKSSDIL